MTAKLLMIALDGADGRLLEAMSQSGELPNLTNLRRRGTFHFMDNRTEMSDDSIWASFQFGTPLSDHGRYHYLVRLKSGWTGMAVHDEDACATFWNQLSAQGLSVCIIDVPKCPSPVALNGVHLADWSVHGHYFKAPQSYPAGLAEQVVAEFGTQDCKWCGFFQPPLEDDQVIEIASDLISSIEKKRRVATRQLERTAWDIAIVGFKEAHCAGHGLWQFADPGHAEFDGERTSRLGNPVACIYRALDSAIGELLSTVSPETEVVVFSNCFMEPNGSVLPLRAEICNRLNHVLSKRHDVVQGLRVAGPRGTPAREPHRFCSNVEVNDNQLALKLSCRNPNQFSGMLQDTSALLAGLRDAETGLAVFHRIDQPSTLQQGEAVGRLPDVVAWCRPNATPRAVISPDLGRIEAIARRVRPGNHSMGGAIFAAGAKASALSSRLKNVSDFAGFSRAFFMKAPAS